MNAPFRPCGDFYRDQEPWACDDCGGSEYSCDCTDEPEAARCPHCDEPLIASGCRDCELSLAPVVRVLGGGVAA